MLAGNAGLAVQARPRPWSLNILAAARLFSLRHLIALAFAMLILVVTAILGLLLERTAARTLEAEIGLRLAQTAVQMADKLDRGMFERWRDLQVAASLLSVGEPALSPDQKRGVIEKLQATYPAWAWIGLIDAEKARVVVSTGRIFEGGDASARPWWRAAMSEPIVADVHEAKVLAKLLPPDPDGKPQRFVDLAAPVAVPANAPGQVLAAHLSWVWAENVRRSVVSAGQEAGTEVLIVAQDDTVLLGPASLVWKELAPSLARQAVGWRVETWPDGRDFLTASAPTRGHGDYPGLGWRIVARVPAEEAFAPARALQRTSLIAGAAVAAAFMLLAWFASGWIAAPLDALTQAADRIREEPHDNLRLPLSGRYREVAALSRALDELLRANAVQRQELQAALVEKTTLLLEIHHRIKNNLQLIVGLLAVDQRRTANAEAAALFGRAIQRINAMALVHQQLYTASSLSRIDFAAHLRVLATSVMTLADNPERKIAIDVDAEPLHCGIEAGLPLALIANELIANSLKHAFAGRTEGRIAITLRADEGGGTTLIVSDNGIGSAVERHGSGIGRQLVDKLVQQLGATLREIVTERGRTVVLDLPPGCCAASHAMG